MGAIIAVISDKLKDPCESDREIKQNAIIKELQLMENYTSCYLEERAKPLLTPWVTKGFPWDQSSEPINEIISEAKGNSPGSSKTTESNTESQFTCHHFTSPHTCKSLYHRSTYNYTKSCSHGYYRICNICNNSNFNASILACQQYNEYDCYCQCSVCGGPHLESMCGHTSSVSPSCGFPSSWTNTYDNQNQTDHESEVINSDDCKEENIENPSDQTNSSDFTKDETVETSLWDEEDDRWMLKAEKRLLAQPSQNKQLYFNQYRNSN